MLIGVLSFNLYPASEVIFSLDYDAYREVGTELCQGAIDVREGDDGHTAVQYIRR